MFFFSGGGGGRGLLLLSSFFCFVENGFDIFRVATSRGQEQHLDQFFLFFLGECAVLVLCWCWCSLSAADIYIYICSHDDALFYSDRIQMMMMMRFFLLSFL